MVMALTLMSAMLFVSCGSKEEELVKWIPAPHFSGQHADLLKCTADSVKVILTKATDSDKSWEVRAMVPMANTMPWSDVPGTDKNQSQYFTASMSNLHAEFLDANGSPIDYEIEPDRSKVAAMLASDTEAFEDVWFTIFWESHRGKYDKMKGIFDKVQGMEIKKAELTKCYTSSSSFSSSKSSSSKSSSEDDWSDAYDKALDAYDKALDAAAKASNVTGVKSAKEAVDAYKDALKSLDDMDDDW